MIWRSSFTNQDKFLCQPMHSFENTRLHLCPKMLSQQHLISFLFLRRLSQDLVVVLWDESRNLRYKNAYYLCVWLWVPQFLLSIFLFFFFFFNLLPICSYVLLVSLAIGRGDWSALKRCRGRYLPHFLS